MELGIIFLRYQNHSVSNTLPSNTNHKVKHETRQIAYFCKILFLIVVSLNLPSLSNTELNVFLVKEESFVNVFIR